jgi:hypothetical protein
MERHDTTQRAFFQSDVTTSLPNHLETQALRAFTVFSPDVLGSLGGICCLKSREQLPHTNHLLCE